MDDNDINEWQRRRERIQLVYDLIGWGIIIGLFIVGYCLLNPP